MNQPVSRKLFFLDTSRHLDHYSLCTNTCCAWSFPDFWKYYCFPSGWVVLEVVQSSRGKAGIAGCVYTFNLGGHNLCAYLFACGDLGGDCPSKVSITQGRFDSDLSSVTFHNPTDWIGNRIDVGLWWSRYSWEPLAGWRSYRCDQSSFHGIWAVSSSAELDLIWNLLLKVAVLVLFKLFSM